MWKLIKWLFFLAIIAAIIMMLTGEKIRGKTIEEHLQPIIGSKAFKEAVHDIRALVGEGLKTAGEVISEDVTEEERQQLTSVLKQELLEGKPVEVAPGQTALAPQQQVPSASQALPPRPTPQQMEAQARATSPAATSPAAAAPRTIAPLPAAPASPPPSAPPRTTQPPSSTF
jgi:hypothetical protein